MESQFRLLSILDEENELVDITDSLKQLALQLRADEIVKLPDFDLFEGTHALEVNNVKLDSTLLELTPAELEFDSKKAYGEDRDAQIVFVTSVVDRLCRSIMDWLNDYQSLPTTVLSCRYVDYLSERCKKVPKGKLEEAQLNTGSELYDKVLSTCVFATFSLIHFVDSLLRAGVIYEEEDLNCNTMGLYMLDDVPVSEISDKLLECRQLIEEKYPEGKRLLLLVCLFENLIKIHQYRPLVNRPPSENVEPLQNLITVAEELNKDNWIHEPPPGSFSRGIQKFLSNQHPPKQLYEPTGQEYLAYGTMAKDILSVLEVRFARSVVEIRQFAWFFNRSRQRHVIARALFPLYLMRDDQSILGIYTFSDFTHQTVLNFALSGTQMEKHILEEGDEEFKTNLNDFYQEISAALFEWYQNMAQNTCRYRQGYNRQLLLWDSLQAKLEPFETKLESKGIIDRISQLEDVSLMPLNTWVYFMKLISMLEFTLKGFELEVYKSWEFFTMYWYSYYLAYHLGCCLQRVQAFLEDRTASIQSMNKKLKKLKSGPKKDKLRAQYHELMNNTTPQLRQNLQFVNYMTSECTLIKSLCLAQVLQFGILVSYGIIDSNNPAATKFSKNEFLHELRFKTFSSIGVPELPTYETFKDSLSTFTFTEPGFVSKCRTSHQLINKELETAKSALENIIKSLKFADNTEGQNSFTGNRLVEESALEWYSKLEKNIFALKLNGAAILYKLGDVPSDASLKKYKAQATYVSDACKYFPILKLQNISTK
ncbi:Mak10p Ecym_5471 [Eremothecium cymbalariae DBVPG|uniref:Uncharacterized protein n=1 Tax=Eremothecium cymbalariae (strain CBS 270.75 / DBVPG 7215 / KCTC 17166 / NRRL Y-17582) TaxID=931890 RepID=I6NDS6_ERECY|nr:hypothetical protein Ecym_5471 [Eremothecium cymbalariae DBVPG\